MKILKYLVLFIVTFLFQITLLDLISIKDIVPDLLLIGVIIFTLREGQLAGTMAGFVVGLFQDFYMTSFSGLAALSKSVAAFASGYFCKRTQVITFYFLTTVFVVAILIHDLVYHSILYLGSELGVFKILFRYALPQSFYTFVFGMILNVIFYRMLWTK